MLDWDDFKFFSAVARAGSVRGAAKELGVHASTVTRRLEHFEVRLGIRLFARTSGGLVITPEGAEVVETLDEVAMRLEGVEQRLKGRDRRMAGVVRVNVPEALAAELFMPEIGRFSRQYPEVIVEVSRQWRQPDLDKREVDLSVVLTDDPPGHLIGRPLGNMALAGYRRLDLTGEFEGRWLGSALEAAIAPDYVAQMFPAARVSGVLETVDLQLAAVLAGLGSTLLPGYLADRRVELCRTQAEEGQRAEIDCPMWLLSHPDSRDVVRIQALARAMLNVLRGIDVGSDMKRDMKRDTKTETRSGESER